MSKRRASDRTPKNRPPPRGIRNALLAVLPADDLQRIVSDLEVIPLKLKAVLHKPGEPIDYVYFPGGGFCSILTVLEDGSMVEVATIGREGMLGSSAVVHSGRPAQSLTMVQGETGCCYQMSAGAFRREMARGGAFHLVLTQFAEALMGFVMQSTACNAVHSVEQRLARWLLLAQDRMESNSFPLTQEFVAMMLGAARPTVSIVAATLQRAGLITYHRGLVTIVDRENLEGASCECYAVTSALLRAVTDRERDAQFSTGIRR